MSNGTQWETRRQDDRIATNADQTEFEAIRYGSCNLEAGTADDRIVGALDDYEVSDPQSPSGWAVDDHALDNAASDIATEVRRRRESLRTAYPFRVERNRLIYESTCTLVYEFCLAASQAPNLAETPFNMLPVAFERLTRDVLVRFLGPGSKGFRTGWPPDEREFRPTRFKQLVAHLHQLTGEWNWQPDPGLPDDPEPQDVKDAGLDLVVWKTVPDGRNAALFLLGQCACTDNYSTKFHDLDPDLTKLTRWIKPISWVRPVRVFATSRHIPNRISFWQANREAGWTFDRVRIALLAESDTGWATRSGKPRDEYEAMIRLVIPGFQVVPRATEQRPRRAGAARRSQSRGSVP